MAAKDDDLPRAKPGEDPYEIEWPDDSAEQRAAERAQAARKAAIKPAPRLLTIACIGTGMVLAFIGIVSAMFGAFEPLVIFTWPIVAAGVLVALPIWLALDRVTRGWRAGWPEILFMAVGILIGASWTHGGLSLLMEITNVPITETESEAQALADEGVIAIFRDHFNFLRSIAGVFMATAVASGFMAARFWTERLRMRPRAVYAMTVAITVLTIASVVSFVS